MPDPDFFGFFKFQPGPVTQTVKILTLEGETLKIESTLPKKAEFFIQCPNDVMLDPDFFHFSNFQWDLWVFTLLGKIESTLTKEVDLFIQCPNDVMPDPDFSFFEFRVGPVDKTARHLHESPENRKYIDLRN